MRMAETEAAQTVTAEAPAVAERPAKAKKPRVLKERKPKMPKSAPAHPPYFQMIREAITALHEKSGSSAYAIAKHMESKHKAVLPVNYKKKLALQLKNAAAKGKLIKVKASFKLADLAKASAAPAKKPANGAAKLKVAPKKAPTARSAKKPAVKRTAKKKALPTKPKAKSIKSAKSSVANKPKKAT